MTDVAATLTAAAGVITGVGALVVTYMRTRASNTNSSLKIKQQLDQQIDERVSAQLTEAWARISQLELQVGTLTDDRDFQKSAVRTLGDGLEAVLDYVERTTPTPQYTRREKQYIDDAKALLADDLLWNTSARLKANSTKPKPKEKQ